MARNYFFNLDAEDPSLGLVRSFTDESQADPPIFTRGDNFTANCYFVRRNPFPVPARPFIYVSAPSTFKLAAGEIDATPSGGTFTLTGGAGGTTAAIAYNAAASAVQTAVRAGMTGFGSAVVTGPDGGPWLIDYGATGAQTDITGTATALTPSGSTVVIVNAQDGNGSVDEQWEVSLARALPMLQTSWSATPSATVTVTNVQVGSATANKVYSISWNDDAYSGSVWLAVSTTGSNTQTVGPIAYNATAAQVATVFAQHTAIATTDINVEQTAPCSFNVTFIGTLDLDNAPTIATASNTLSVPPGLTGTVAISTYGANVILNGEDSADVAFEAECRFSAGQPQTACRITNAQFVADLITSTPGQTTGDENWATIEDVYDARTRVFADTTARNAATPDFAGQLYYMQSTGELGYALSTTLGDWGSGFYIGSIGTTAISRPTAGSITIDATTGIALQYNSSTKLATTSTGVSVTGSVTASTFLATSGFKAGIVTKTGTYTATTSDFTILGDASGGAFDIDLPTAASASGHVFVIKKVDSSGNAVSIDPNGTELIDGSSTSVALSAQWQSYIIQSDGTSWFVLAQF